MNISFQLSVSVFREGKAYVAYSPALDISTAGKSLTEAKSRFEELVQIFFEELERKGTLDDALTSLGWERKTNEWIPPIEVSHAQERFNVRVGV